MTQIKDGMVDRGPVATRPLFSVIVPVYNAWGLIDDCLSSISRQTNPPAFEVVVVDDGSPEGAPESIRGWTRHYPLTVIRQHHAGPSAARNRGLQAATGAVLLCVDADCRLQHDCLTALAKATGDRAQTNFFQLHLTGDRSGAVGRAEELRLITIQEHMLQPDGSIRYLNTAGFAIRRRAEGQEGLFEPSALRGEDTLLLADLIERGELPLFVPTAVVEHAILLSFAGAFARTSIRHGRRARSTGSSPPGDSVFR